MFEVDSQVTQPVRKLARRDGPGSPHQDYNKDETTHPKGLREGEIMPGHLFVNGMLLICFNAEGAECAEK